MTFSVLDFQFLINPVHQRKVENIGSEEIKNIEKSLDDLATLLHGNFQWILSGGMIIPLITGGYSRVHFDFDIEILPQHLQTMVETTKIRGYNLFSRTLMAKLSPCQKLDVYRSVSPEEASKGLRNLRLARLDNGGKIIRHTNLMDYIDIYLYDVAIDGVFLRENGVSIPFLQKSNETYTTQSGHQIAVRPLWYIEKLKAMKPDDLNSFDLRVVDWYTSQHA